MSHIGYAKTKNIPDIISVNIKLIMVEYLIVVSKFFAFFAPYAIPDTVIVAIPIAMQGRNAIVMNLQAIVNDATSFTPAVTMIR